MTPPQATRLAWITASPLRLSLLAFALACCTAWLRPLLLPDEGRYAGVAWEMLRSGDWLTPTLNGLPYFHKPPLFYWLTASSLVNTVRPSVSMPGGTNGSEPVAMITSRAL